MNSPYVSQAWATYYTCLLLLRSFLQNWESKAHEQVQQTDGLHCQAAKPKSKESCGATRYTVSTTGRLGTKKAVLGIQVCNQLIKISLQETEM